MRRMSTDNKAKRDASVDEKIHSRHVAPMIKSADLYQIIVKVFDDEYNPIKIRK